MTNDTPQPPPVVYEPTPLAGASAPLAVCRSCHEEIHPDAVICKHCLTHQHYPRWIQTITPAIGMILALVSITSLIISDIWTKVFPERGAIAAYIASNSESAEYFIMFENIGHETVTVEPEISCEVHRPKDYKPDFTSKLPYVFPLTFVRPMLEEDGPITVFPNERQRVRYEIREFSLVNALSGGDLAFHSIAHSWQGSADLEAARKAAYDAIQSPEEFIKLLAHGVPEDLDPPWAPAVLDPSSGDHVVWQCAAKVHDRFGEIDFNPIINRFVEASVFPSTEDFVWRLVFSSNEPEPFNPDQVPWGSSCGDCPSGTRESDSGSIEQEVTPVP